MNIRALLDTLLSPWVLIGSLVVGVGLFCAALLGLWIARPGPGAAAPATAVMQVILLPTPTPTMVVPTATPTPEVLPSPPPGVLSLNAFVQVTGTGGDGLRLRSDPGLNGTIKFLGLEGEIFQVTDGPRESDGYTWWYLIAPYDANVRGWAVSNFLQAVPQP